MRSAIALTALLSVIVSACSDKEGPSTGASGGNQTASGNDTSTGAAKGGASATSAKASGGSGTRTSTRASAASGGSSGSSRSAAATGGRSKTEAEETGGASSDGGAGGDTTATGGRSSEKSSAGGSGGKSSGSKSSSSSAAGGQATGGTASTNATTSTGGQAVGGGTSQGSGKSAGCGKAPGIASGQYNNGQPISITAGGKQRRFILNVPTNYDNTHPYRLIVVYHQLDGNDKQMYNWQYYGLLPLSNNSTIFVAPNGQKNGSPCSGTGDGDSGCGWPNSGDSDLALADAVVAEIEENFCIDTNRIFATGWSYGGSMSYRTACSRPQGGTASWGVRGIAIYAAAQLSGNCTPSKPVAFYHAHGTRDSVLNYDNMGLPLAQNFAKANGCTWATPTKVTSGAHACTNLTGCMEGYPLEFCSFNGDHTPFPDNGQAQGSWGPQEAWKFLSQF